MIKQAVILVPKVDEELPSYLFCPVAGVPFLARQVLGLGRAGISAIAILAPPDLGGYLAREFARQKDVPGTIQIISRWPDDAESGPGYFLTLLATTLPDRKSVEALLEKPPPPGALTLGVVDRSRVGPGGAQFFRDALDVKLAESRLGSLVTAVTRGASENGWQAAGLALFSQAAWKDWHDWLRGQAAGPHFHPDLGAGDFYGFVAQKVRDRQVLGAVLDPVGVFAIASEQDQAAATARLIAAQDSSPLGEGILENSWNRKIARLILPWLLTQGITPNQITLASFLVGLLAVWGFAQGSYGAAVGAAVLLPVILVMDCLDGAVARLKFQETRLGALLDLHGDSLLNLLLFLGITLGSYRATGQLVYLAAGVLLTFGYTACWWLNNTEAKSGIAGGHFPGEQMNNSEKILEEAASRDFFYIILLAAILNCLDWMILATAAGANIFAWIFYRRKADGQH